MNTRRYDLREKGLVSGNAAVASTFLVFEPNKLSAETRLEHATSAATPRGKGSFILPASLTELRPRDRVLFGSMGDKQGNLKSLALLRSDSATILSLSFDLSNMFDIGAPARTSPMMAFFYGTLMVPDIIKRVTRTDGKHLEIAPAILMVRELSKSSR